MKIGELFVSLTFKTEGQGDLVKAYNDVQNLGRASGALALGIGAMSAGFIAMISESAAAGNALKNFQLTTGLSTDSLQQWEYRAQRAGVGAGVVQGAITKMATKMGEVIKSGQFAGLTGWTVFGVDPSANPFETFDRLNAKFKTLNDPNKLNLFRSFATDLGISDNLVALFRRDLTGIELPKKLLLDQQNIDALDTMYGKILGIKVEIGNAGDKFSSVFGPAVDSVTTKLDVLLKKWADFSNTLNSGTPDANKDKAKVNKGAETLLYAGLGVSGLVAVTKVIQAVVGSARYGAPVLAPAVGAYGMYSAYTGEKERAAAWKMGYSYNPGFNYLKGSLGMADYGLGFKGVDFFSRSLTDTLLRLYHGPQASSPTINNTVNINGPVNGADGAKVAHQVVVELNHLDYGLTIATGSAQSQ